MNDIQNPRPGLWARLRRPSPRWSVLALASVGFVAGAISWGGFEASLQATNSTQFCTGCHEMRDTVYAEFRGTIHDRNRTGVRASCGDCHVPRDWMHKLARKVHSTNEVYHALAGTIDTPAKFEAQRLALATRVWDDMKASNSRECRNCHAFEAMDLGRQQEFARMAHHDAPANGQTCIDCHKGIAHALPRD